MASIRVTQVNGTELFDTGRENRKPGKNTLRNCVCYHNFTSHLALRFTNMVLENTKITPEKGS